MADFGNIEVDGLVEQQQALESLLMTNPAMEKKVQGLIRKVLLAARRTLSNNAKGAMKSDPRQAYKAVKTAVYRQILGGSVSILNKRKRGTQFSAYEPLRNPSPRGGNRRARSQRTNDVMHYAGSDRAFILRFLNEGTQNRTVEFMPNSGRKVDKWNKHPNTGNRGRMAPRNFFSNSSHTAMQQAAVELTKLIDELIQQELK